MTIARVAALALCCAHAAAQSPCIDTSYDSGNTNGLEVTANQNVTQTFTINGTGLMRQIDIDDFRLHGGSSGQLPFDVSIVDVDAAGVPLPTVLFTQTFAPTTVTTTPSTHSVDVTSAGIVVQPGDRFGIKLTTATPSSGPTYAWGGDAPGTYAAGAIFIHDNVGPLVFDLGFKVWVDPGASVTSYGTDFGGTNGAPTLDASPPPVRGQPFDILCGNPQPNTAVASLLIGAQPVSIPTPFGGTLLVQPIGSIGLQLPANGVLPLTSIVADDATSCGLVVQMQLLTLDPSAAFGIGFSAGMELTVGY